MLRSSCVPKTDRVLWTDASCILLLQEVNFQEVQWFAKVRELKNISKVPQ